MAKFRLVMSASIKLNDYIFRHNGRDVGQCSLCLMSNGEQQWRWTIYIGKTAQGVLPSVPTAGYASTLVMAQEQFGKSFQRMVASAVVNGPIFQALPRGRPRRLQRK